MHNRNKLQDGLIYGKVAPQAVELEEAVLGAILTDKNAYDVVADILQPNCFYQDNNVKTFTAISNLKALNKHVDIFTVIEALKAMGELEAVGGPYFLTKLTNAVVSSAHIETHARIVLQKFVQRELIRISGEVIAEAYDETTDVLELFNKAEIALFKISNSFFKSNYQTAADLAFKNIEQVEALQNRTVDLTGVPSGYSSINSLTCGWQPTDLIILAARPSVGKTAFALNLALNACMNYSKPTPVAFFSLEMSASQITSRCISYIGQIDLHKIARGRMSDSELKEYKIAAEKFGALYFFVDDTAALTIHHLRSKAKQLVSKEKVGLIVVDYLQLMSDDKQKGNREQEISTISRNLKALAKDLNVPIIALSQMSRAIETRKGGSEPMLSDLRESGAIEQDADVVAFLMRDDYGMKQNEADPTIANKAWVKFAKHRNGSLEKLAFETNLSTQTWTEFGFSNKWQQVNKSPVPIVQSNNTEDDDMPF